MNKTHSELVALAETMGTAELKAIQRHQRTRLMLAGRSHDRGAAHFMQVRVDAVAEVLASRKAAK